MALDFDNSLMTDVRDRVTCNNLAGIPANDDPWQLVPSIFMEQIVACVAICWR